MKLTYIGVFAAAMLVSVAPSFAANIVVPNGDFTNTNNDGSIGGGIVNPNGSSVIGLGPWSGSYTGILGLLAPPTLDIDDDPTTGHATIAGIAGLNLGTITDSTGAFFQTLGVGYAANTTYTLTADVAAGSVLSVAALDNFGVGIALLNGGALTAASTDPHYLLGLNLLGGGIYQLSMQFTTGATAPSGNIGVSMFDAPVGLATANVLGAVTFSNVSLDASPASAAPEPGAFVLVGVGLLALTKVRKLVRQ